MPPIRGSSPPGIGRSVTTALVGLMLTYAGTFFDVRKDVSRPVTDTTVQRWTTASGSDVQQKGRIDKDGNLYLSGAVIANGITLGAGGGGASVDTGAILNAGNSRFVNVSGDTMTGALNVRANLSGSALFTLSSYRNCTIKTTATGMTICGADIDTDTNTTYTAGHGLQLVGTQFRTAAVLTGSTVRGLSMLASSGGLVWEGAASGASLWVSTFEGAGLTDCDGDAQGMGWDATLKRFVCGDDDSGGGGGTPGGSNTQIQFNDAGAFGGDSEFTFAKSSDLITNGSFTGNAAGWTLTGWTYSVNAIDYTQPADPNGAYQAVPLTFGVQYRVSFTVTGTTGQVSLCSSDAAFSTDDCEQVDITGGDPIGPQAAILNSFGATGIAVIASTDFDGTVDSISVINTATLTFDDMTVKKDAAKINFTLADIPLTGTGILATGTGLTFRTGDVNLNNGNLGQMGGVDFEIGDSFISGTEIYAGGVNVTAGGVSVFDETDYSGGGGAGSVELSAGGVQGDNTGNNGGGANLEISGGTFDGSANFYGGSLTIEAGAGTTEDGSIFLLVSDSGGSPGKVDIAGAAYVFGDGVVSFGDDTPAAGWEFVMHLGDSLFSGGNVEISGGGLDLNGGGFINTGGSTLLGGGKLIVGNNADTADEGFDFTTNPLEVLGTMSGQSLAIGGSGTTANVKLHVYGTGNQYARINSANASDAGIELMRPGSGRDFRIADESGNLNIRYSTDDFLTTTSMMFFAPASNRIGILTGAPDTTLEVIGTMSGVSVVAGDSIFVSDTANAGMTKGITIDQEGNDNQILALRSTGDVAHGVTNTMETSIYGAFLKNSAANGGLLIRGFSDLSTAYGLVLQGHSTQADTAKSTTALSTVRIDSTIFNGTTSQQAVGANGNLVTFSNFGTVRMIIDAEGTIHTTPASDTAVDLMTVQVTGTPTFGWNETKDTFTSNQDIWASSGGGFSGATMTINGVGASGSGKLILYGKKGGKLCKADTDGAGFTTEDCNNGVCTNRIATGTECSL